MRRVLLLAILLMSSTARAQDKHHFETRADIQKHLGMTPAQAKAIRQAERDYQALTDRIIRDIEKANAKGVEPAGFDHEAGGVPIPDDDYRRAVAKAMTPGQRKRAFEIRLQVEGYRALQRPDIQERLRLDDVTLTLLKQGIAEDNQRVQTAYARLPRNSTPKAYERALAGIKDEHRDWQRKHYGRIIGPKKLAAFQAMMGEPFKWQDRPAKN